MSCVLFICADLMRVSNVFSLIANFHKVKFDFNPKSFNDSVIRLISESFFDFAIAHDADNGAAVGCDVGILAGEKLRYELLRLLLTHCGDGFGACCRLCHLVGQWLEQLCAQCAILLFGARQHAVKHAQHIGLVGDECWHTVYRVGILSERFQLKTECFQVG